MKFFFFFHKKHVLREYCFPPRLSKQSHINKPRFDKFVAAFVLKRKVDSYHIGKCLFYHFNTVTGRKYVTESWGEVKSASQSRGGKLWDASSFSLVPTLGKMRGWGEFESNLINMHADAECASSRSHLLEFDDLSFHYISRSMARCIYDMDPLGGVK
jgi:hypothetical protein